MIRISDISMSASLYGRTLLPPAQPPKNCVPMRRSVKKRAHLSNALWMRRKKQDVRFVVTAGCDEHGHEQRKDDRAACPACATGHDHQKRRKEPMHTPPPHGTLSQRPVVVGFGPAGMFAGLLLARAGLRPMILERGGSVEERQAAVNTFWQMRKLNPSCNVQFGEGGAGTFSDGKLNTGTKDERMFLRIANALRARRTRRHSI